MCSSIVFVPNKICRAAAAFLLFGSKNISAVLLFPSSILLRAITTGDAIIITQKHAVKTIHATKIVTSPSNEIVLVRKNDSSFPVKCLSGRAFEEGLPRKLSILSDPGSSTFLFFFVDKQRSLKVQTIHSHVV